MTIRVLVVTNMYPTPTRPMLGIFVAEQVASLRRRGLDVDVLFMNGPASRWEYARGVGRVLRAVQAREYDLIHAHYVYSGIVALAGARIPVKGGRLPIVLTQHGMETERRWMGILCRWTSRQVTQTIATSRRVQAALRRPDAAIVPCGVDIELFRPMPRSQARAGLQLPAEAPLVLFAGMRRPEKRFDLVEAAVERLRTARPDVRLVVADREPHERMPLFMNACDVLILASEGEGSPMVIKEAMACNLPIVSVDVGDVAEVISGTAGCFIVKREPSELAAGLARALDFGGRTEGRSAILHLSLDAIAGRLEAVYRDVIARARRGRGLELQP